MSDSSMCICGHELNRHFNYEYCLVDKSDNTMRVHSWIDHCPCKKFEQMEVNQPSIQVPSGVHIQTLLDNNGEARILFEFGEVKIQLTQEACADIALHLLAATYASRSEQALFKYAMDNALDPQQLVKFMRS